MSYEHYYKILRKINSGDLHQSYPYLDTANQTRIRAYNTRHGFVSPRYTSSQINSFEKCSSYPNYHGGYTKLNVRPLFRFDERALKNV